jgi:hypothetical protein
MKSALLILVSAYFEFNMIIYFNFYFVLGFIYLLMVICGSFELEKLFDFISAHYWVNVALYFSLKNLFCESFLNLN